MPVEVVNLGVPGFEVSDVAAHFHNTFPSFQPDIVILTYNYGDITSSQIVIEPGGQTRVGLAVHGQRGSWRTDARALKALLYSKSMLMRFLIPRVDSTLRPDVIPFLDPQSEPEYREVADNGTKWRSARAHVESMLRTTEAAGASMLVVMYPPSLCDFLCYGDLYAMVQARFEDMGIRVINPRHRFEGAKASDYQATLLDNHPDEASYRMVAEEVERALAALLRSRGLAD
jgi:hypothetical protein